MTLFEHNEQLPLDSFSGEFSFLSNFHYSPFKWKTVNVPTVEHAYQAEKAINEVDFMAIICAHSPAKAKQIGKSIKRRPDWELIKDGIMLKCLRLKFAIPEFREKLLNTGDRMLIEGNWWGDTYWGVCRGEGLNRLGTLLMNLREEIRNELQRP